MTQTTFSVVTMAAGFIVVELRQEVGSRYCVRTVNVVEEVLPNMTFKLLLSSFATEERRSPKGIVVALASKYSLAMVPIFGEDGDDVARCLNISQAESKLQE